MEFLIYFIIIFIIALICCIFNDNIRSPEEKEQQSRRLEEKKHILQYGHINTAMICPHCQQKGTIRTLPVKRKKGISGAKATGAVLTFGVSMLATGLSRKEGMTQAHCDNCGSTWDF